MVLFANVGSAKLSNQSQIASTRDTPVVNGEPRESNLAAALGLESDEEEDNSSSPPPLAPLQKSPQAIQKISALSPQSQKVILFH